MTPPAAAEQLELDEPEAIFELAPEDAEAIAQALSVNRTVDGWEFLKRLRET